MLRFALNVSYLLVCLAVISEASEVKKCPGSNAKKLASSDITVTNCNKGVCKLKKKSEVEITINFSPESDLPDLTTLVTGELFSLPLPFIGVDNTSAKTNVFNEDGKTNADWPLKKGNKYVYKRSFKILDFYPNANVLVHWSLSYNNQDIVCFELPSKIL